MQQQLGAPQLSAALLARAQLAQQAQHNDLLLFEHTTELLVRLARATSSSHDIRDCELVYQQLQSGQISPQQALVEANALEERFCARAAYAEQAQLAQRPPQQAVPMVARVSCAQPLKRQRNTQPLEPPG
jgi:hypothetical protein